MKRILKRIWWFVWIIVMPILVYNYIYKDNPCVDEEKDPKLQERIYYENKNLNFSLSYFKYNLYRGINDCEIVEAFVKESFYNKPYFHEKFYFWSEDYMDFSLGIYHLEEKTEKSFLNNYEKIKTHYCSNFQEYQGEKRNYAYCENLDNEFFNLKKGTYESFIRTIIMSEERKQKRFDRFVFIKNYYWWKGDVYVFENRDSRDRFDKVIQSFQFLN